MNAAELRDLLRELDRQGFDPRRSRSGHFKVYQGSELITTIAGSPSDWRASRNLMSRLRRAGFDPTPLGWIRPQRKTQPRQGE